jgi:hypothetical protein
MLPGLATARAQTNQSVYTSLERKHCRTLKSNASDAGGSAARCPGVAGYTLLVEEDDLRNNIQVRTPRGGEHSLDLWTIVSGGFSSLGPKAEWRMSTRNGKLIPVALIVRFNANEDSAQPDRVTSYLAVSKITAEAICVTDKILPGVKANDEARSAADTAGTRTCLKAK